MPHRAFVLHRLVVAATLSLLITEAHATNGTQQVRRLYNCQANFGITSYAFQYNGLASWGPEEVVLLVSSLFPGISITCS